MKSFLQYISKEDLEFYLEDVADHSEYITWVKDKNTYISTLLNKKVDIIKKLTEQTKIDHTELFLDKTTFKLFNSIDWSLDKLNELKATYKQEKLTNLVDAWTESTITHINKR